MSAGRIRTLYIHGHDRDDSFSASLESSFEDASIELSVSFGGTDALKQIEAENFDCVVTTVDLTDMEVTQLIDLISDYSPSLPVIVVGEPEEPRTVVHLLNQGVSQYLMDPDFETELLPNVRRCAVRYRSETALRNHRHLKTEVIDILNAVVDASSLPELRESITTYLTSSDWYEFAWMAEYQKDTDRFVIRDALHNEVPIDDLNSFLPRDARDQLQRVVQTKEVTATSRDVLMRGAASQTQQAQRPDIGENMASTRQPTKSMNTLFVPVVYDESVYEIIIITRTGGDLIDGSERSLLGKMGRIVGRFYWFIVESMRTKEAKENRLEPFMQLFAHELRTPLSVAMGNVDQLKSHENEDIIERVDRALSDIDNVVKTFLSAVKSEGVNQTSFRDLAEAAETAWKEVGIDSATMVIVESSRVEANHRLLERLFSNLFRNAIQHGDSDVTIRVGVTDNGFYVEDDGPGIPPEERDRVLEWGRSSREGNLGLGLSFVQTIVDAHDWELDITESEEGGARFEISFGDDSSEPRGFVFDQMRRDN